MSELTTIERDVIGALVQHGPSVIIGTNDDLLNDLMARGLLFQCAMQDDCPVWNATEAAAEAFAKVEPSVQENAPADQPKQGLPAKVITCEFAEVGIAVLPEDDGYKVVCQTLPRGEALLGGEPKLWEHKSKYLAEALEAFQVVYGYALESIQYAWTKSAKEGELLELTIMDGQVDEI